MHHLLVLNIKFHPLSKRTKSRLMSLESMKLDRFQQTKDF